MKPLYINWDPRNESTESLIEKVKTSVHQYKKEYKQYFDRNKNDGDVMFEAKTARYFDSRCRNGQHRQKHIDGKREWSTLPPRDCGYERGNSTW